MPGPLPDVAAGHSVPRQDAIAELEAWHRLVICGRPEQAGVARGFVRQVLGASHPGIERVTLLTSELVTNSVTHSASRLDSPKQPNAPAVASASIAGRARAVRLAKSSRSA